MYRQTRGHVHVIESTYQREQDIRVNQDNIICEELLGAVLFEVTVREQDINLKYLKQHYSSLILTKNLAEKKRLVKI